MRSCVLAVLLSLLEAHHASDDAPTSTVAGLAEWPVPTAL